MLRTFHFLENSQYDGGSKQILVGHPSVQHWYEMLQALLMIAVAHERVNNNTEMAHVSRGQCKDSVEEDGTRPGTLGHTGFERPSWVTRIQL